MAGNKLRKLAALGIGTGVAAATIGGLIVHDKTPNDAPQAVAHYYGRPGVPGSKSLDKLSAFGNFDITLFDDNHAEFFVVGPAKSHIAAGTLACNSDNAILVHAQPGTTQLPAAVKQTVTIDRVETGDIAHTMCHAGRLSINGIELAGFARQTS